MKVYWSIFSQYSLFGLGYLLYLREKFAGWSLEELEGGGVIVFPVAYWGCMQSDIRAFQSISHLFCK